MVFREHWIIIECHRIVVELSYQQSLRSWSFVCGFANNWSSNEHWSIVELSSRIWNSEYRTWNLNLEPFQNVESRIWNLGYGILNSEPGPPNANSWIPIPESRMPNPASGIQNPESRFWNSGSRTLPESGIQKSGSRILKSEPGIQNSKSSVNNPKSRINTFWMSRNCASIIELPLNCQANSHEI